MNDIAKTNKGFLPCEPSHDNAVKLCEITSKFYSENSESFSQTRNAPWHGWGEVLKATKLGGATNDTIKVLDLGCGNLRFENFLVNSLSDCNFNFHAVDNCESLACEHLNSLRKKQNVSIEYQNLDVMGALSANVLLDALNAQRQSFNLAVAFGFMHHIPRFHWRLELLRTLAAYTEVGSCFAVSFWQFLNSEKLAKKAYATTKRAREVLGLGELGNNNFLLGWQNSEDAFRFAHHFTERELCLLKAKLADTARAVCEFSSDGKQGNLNRYIVFEVFKKSFL